MDSFKGNISSLQASEAVARGVRRGCPWAELKILPIADGGEGTVDVFVRSMHGCTIRGSFTGPLGYPIEAG